jgi:hypothetical protein
MGAHLFLFWDYERGVSIRELPNIPNFLMMSQSIWLLQKKMRERKL